MLKSRKILIIFLLLILINPRAFSLETGQNKNILILFSLIPSTPAYRVITEGLRTKLTGAYGDSYNLHMEYLESERYPKGEYPKERFDLFNQKYKDVSLDLLVCVGVDILEPVNKNASEKILNLPTIVIDFDLSDYGIKPYLKLNDRTAAIAMKLNILATLNTALELFPDRNSVFFVGGISKSDRLYFTATRNAADKFDRSKKYTWITDVSMDEVLGLVRHLPDNSLIVIPGFNSDSKMVPYYNPESIRLISQAASVPVFAYTDIGFGDGAVGGYIMSFNKIGQLTGEIAVKILDGTDPASIIVTENEIYSYLFDWRQLKRWNLLDSKLIPKGSIIQFKEISFFGKYKLLIIIVILFFLLQSILIISLVRSNRKKGLVSSQLIEMENKFRELVKEDRILSLGMLTASLSHELNQPLTSILSMSQAGNRYLESGKPDMEMLKEIFHNITVSDKRAATILSSIRGMMKLEKRDKEKANLNLLIEELEMIYTSEAIGKGIKLILELHEQPVFITADKIQIQQVILNFISNASHSIEKINAKNKNIIISEVVDQENVIVSVRDYGEGIPESIKNTLFKPFITSKKEGSGIGLAISRSIIDDHEGKIWAENMSDGGAMFSFSLKICKDD